MPCIQFALAHIYGMLWRLASSDYWLQYEIDDKPESTS